MRNILSIIVHDFKRLTSSMVAIVILMGICVVPCLFAWFNTLSNWDPFEPEATGKVPVAVCSEDKGNEMLGLKINVGELMTEKMEGNDLIGWDIVDKKETALEGVKSGDYYAAIIIPEDFSRDMMSFTSSDLRHPRLDFYENEKTNAIAPKITDRVRQELESEIDKTFVDTLGKYITEVASAAEAQGVDPGEAFSDLSRAMTDLDKDLEDSLTMVSAAAGLSHAASDLLSASDDLIRSSEETLDLGDELLDSAKERVPEKANTSSPKKAIQKVNELLTKNLQAVESDLTAVRNDMDKFNAFVQQDLDTQKKRVDNMKSSTDKIAEDLKKMGLTGLAGRFARISEKLDHMSQRLDQMGPADSSSWAAMQGFIDEVIADIESSQVSISRIEKDLDDTLDNKVNKAVKDARKAISETQNTLSAIYGDLDLLSGALGDSDQALKTLNSGLNGTLATLISLQNGSRNLAELFDSLSNSDMLKDVNHLMTNDAAVIAENMASPIKMRTENIYPIRNFGSEMVPFYTVLAQWIGALLAAVMIHVQVKGGNGLSGIKLHERFFGRYRLFMLIGLAQALLVSLGELLYVGIQCVHPLLFILAACVNGVIFTLIIYSLVFAFGSIGLAASVIVMILQVAGAGGTFPVQVLPPAFRAAYPFMPFQYAMDAMRECTGGIYDHTYLKCLGILILFGIGTAAIGLLMHKPMRGLIEKVEESKEGSDVML